MMPFGTGLRRAVNAGVALAVPLALAACGTVEIFGRYDLPESESVAEAPWPRLVDVPEAPPVGTFTAAVPDPAVGVLTVTDLSDVAQRSATRAEALSAPVLTPADRRALGIE